MKTNRTLLAGLVGALVGGHVPPGGGLGNLTDDERLPEGKPLPPLMPALGVGGFKYQAVKGAFGKFRGSKRAMRFWRGHEQGKTGVFESRVAVDERFKDRAGKIYVRCENGQMRRAYRRGGKKVGFENCGVCYEVE